MCAVYLLCAGLLPFPTACEGKRVNCHAVSFLLVHQQSDGEGPWRIQHRRSGHLWLWNISGRTSLSHCGLGRVIHFLWLEEMINSKQWEGGKNGGKNTPLWPSFCLCEFFVHPLQTSFSSIFSPDASNISAKACHMEASQSLKISLHNYFAESINGSNFLFFRKMALNSFVSILLMKNYSRFLSNWH